MNCVSKAWLARLRSELKSIEDSDEGCSPSCLPGCAGCSPDGYWGTKVSKQLEHVMTRLERISK